MRKVQTEQNIEEILNYKAFPSINDDFFLVFKFQKSENQKQDSLDARNHHHKQVIIFTLVTCTTISKLL